jgi:Radical SAM superfamily
MRTKLHLVAMPWSSPELPSIQIAVLKAYVDSVFGRRVPTRTYSAFASILLEETDSGYADYYEKYEDFEEYPYFLMYCRQLVRSTPRLSRISLDKLITRINNCDAGESLTFRKIAHLERRTCRYIDDTIVPQLSRRALNVVGFTLNYYQLYASIYCARYLRDKYPDYDYLFMFGGATVSYPKVAEVLQRVGVEGLCVIGEGECKLELILREILATPVTERSGLIERLEALHEGIYDIQRRTLNLYETNSASLLELQIPFERLPLPDFDEYYSSLRKAFTDDEQHDKYRAETWLAMEGTRGCFAKCDFCDVHTSWSGFRKSTPERIVDNALSLVHRHRSYRIKFMDNVCDTWAERYAELLIECRIRITSFMECRVHHPEVFWTKLSLSGVELVQVGIEALSPALLRAMNKGTRAKQNLLVQKWLKELGIESLSNLISHHPKSTVAHVRETKHVLQLIPHLDRLDFSNLSLQIGTPLDRSLSPEQRRQLSERQLFELPKGLDQYFVLKGEYEPPDKWYCDGVWEAWDDLVKWEEGFFKRWGEEAFMSSRRCGPGEIVVRDGRFGAVEEHYLEGETATVYQACHQGATLETLMTETEFPAATMQKILSRLMERQLLVELEGFYISLALRPRDELIHNYVASTKHATSPVRDHSAPRVIRELAVLAQ